MRTLTPLLIALTGFSTVFNTGTAQEAEPVFKAGAATSNITPPLGESIVGGWEPFPANNVHDELHARCLVLDDGSTKLVIVLCDNVGIPREVFDSAKQQIHDATGLPVDHILMASTHTHSATTARGQSKVVWDNEMTDYQEFLAHRVSDGVRRAVENLEPARVGWGQVDEPTEVFNRRWYVKDDSMLSNPFGGIDKVRMNPSGRSDALVKPAGPTDPQVSFVSVQSVDGRPIALLANYSLHYVGGVPRGEISADYFGYFAKFIGQKLGAGDQTPPFVGILSNGTSGDINNINFRNRGDRYDAYMKMQEVAGKVASQVFEAHQQIKFQDWVPLSACHKDLTLNVRKPDEETKAYLAKIEASDDDSNIHRRAKTYARRIAKLAESPDQIQVPLQTLTIGDLGIAAVPFEVFVEIGLEIKDRSPLETTFTIELANGSYGYLPTPEQHELGGYETWLGTNYVEYQASVKIVDAVMELFEKCKAAE